MVKVKKKKTAKKRSSGKDYRAVGKKLIGDDILERLIELAEFPGTPETLVEDVEAFLGELYSKNRKQATLLAQTTLPSEWPELLIIGVDYFKKKGK